jgi:hypothetical protein
MKLSQNFSFWESNLRFRGKSGLLTAFSKAIPKTNRVLGIAHIYYQRRFQNPVVRQDHNFEIAGFKIGSPSYSKNTL